MGDVIALRPRQAGQPLTYEQTRSRRKSPNAPIVENLQKMPKRVLKVVYDDRLTFDRPIVRGDCLPGGVNEARPCPFVTCKHHLALDLVMPPGKSRRQRPPNIKVNFPTRETRALGQRADHEIDWEAMPETCALDVADRGPAELERVGEVMALTRERIRQIEWRAFRRLVHDRSPEVMDLREYAGHESEKPAHALAGYGGISSADEDDAPRARRAPPVPPPEEMGDADDDEPPREDVLNQLRDLNRQIHALEDLRNTLAAVNASREAARARAGIHWSAQWRFRPNLTTNDTRGGTRT